MLYKSHKRCDGKSSIHFERSFGGRRLCWGKDEIAMKWLWFLICGLIGLALLAFGLLIPVHLRALDAGVIRAAGRSTTSLPQQANTLMAQGDLGAAQLLVQAAQMARIPESDTLGQTVTNLARQNPGNYFWGDATAVKNIFGDGFDPAQDAAGTLTAFIVRQKNREAALARLGESSSPVVREVLQTRKLSNTVLFYSSQSAAGQAYDTALSICGLLVDNGMLTQNLKQSILVLATSANGGGGSQPFEQVLMDLMSLGQRFNWDQLAAFVAPIQTPDTLHDLTEQIRSLDAQTPVLFAAVELSGQPAEVSKYVADLKPTAMADLTTSLRYGGGGVSELVSQQHRYYFPAWERQVTAFNPFGALYEGMAGVAQRSPDFAMGLKWLCYLLSGFLLAAAFHQVRPQVSPLERPLQVRGVHWFRKFLFSVGFLLVVLLLSEPFLAQDNPKGTFTLRPHLPMAGNVVAAGIAGIKQDIMNPTIILTLLIFFVLQALLYIACLVKLAEIRRQNVPPRVKLRLLENEDHLFDAGLYLGFVGTILSLIVASLHLVTFSLMAAYSSTSFGIIFVVIFKIFHLRPARRQLLMEVETSELSAPAAPLRPVAPVTA